MGDLDGIPGFCFGWSSSLPNRGNLEKEDTDGRHLCQNKTGSDLSHLQITNKTPHTLITYLQSLFSGPPYVYLNTPPFSHQKLFRCKKEQLQLTAAQNAAKIKRYNSWCGTGCKTPKINQEPAGIWTPPFRQSSGQSCPRVTPGNRLVGRLGRGSPPRSPGGSDGGRPRHGAAGGGRLQRRG